MKLSGEGVGLVYVTNLEAYQEAYQEAYPEAYAG